MEKSIENYSRYLQEIAVSALADYWDGSKFSGSLSAIGESLFVDYWTLRKRSMRLFRTNIYAEGVIRRLVWNEINTGLQANPLPVGSVLFGGVSDEEREELAMNYGEKIAVDFALYSSSRDVFDWSKRDDFGAFQERVRMESIISGDGIIISRLDKNTLLPRWQWVNGDHIRTPFGVNVAAGHFIKHGVEFDEWGKRVAFWVESEVNGKISFERIPTRAKHSGRLVSWMVYGKEHFVDDVRGEPFLADALYILKDLDRTRDAEVRASLVNAMIPLFLEEAPNELARARPSDLARGTGGAVLSHSSSVQGAALPEVRDFGGDYDVQRPTNQIDIMNPGTIYKAPSGGKITSFQTNRPNVNYATFERSIIAVLAWSHGVPPEVLMLEFGNNYSASRQANNEFEIYLKRFVKKFSSDVTQPIFESYLFQMVVSGQIYLPGFLGAALDEGNWRVISAWSNCVWSGLSRPSVDRLKEASASEKLLDNGLTTFDIESRRHCGMSFVQVMRSLKRERDIMKKAGFVPHTMEDNNGKPVGEENDGEEE